jgi:hypothetical protein
MLVLVGKNIIQLSPMYYHKRLYSEPNSTKALEGEIKENRNPGERMG